MSEQKVIVVVGLGEVGRPLLELLSKSYKTVGVDIAPPSGLISGVDVLHVCFPFEIKDFVGETVRYIELFKPSVTVINSTVGVGTTRKIAQRTNTAVVHSPVRGKHVRMLEELSRYTKFIGALDEEVGRRVAEHFAEAGIKAKILSTPEASELAKLTETTYFGLLITWAQELERYCDQSGASYDEIISFYEEISFFPSTKYFPGIIGGHCVMPNIDILLKFDDSELLKTIKSSNRAKSERDAAKKTSDLSMSVASSMR